MNSPSSTTRRRRLVAGIGAVVTLVGACSGGDAEDTDDTASSTSAASTDAGSTTVPTSSSASSTSGAPSSSDAPTTPASTATDGTTDTATGATDPANDTSAGTAAPAATTGPVEGVDPSGESVALKDDFDELFGQLDNLSDSLGSLINLPVELPTPAGFVIQDLSIEVSTTGGAPNDLVLTYGGPTPAAAADIVGSVGATLSAAGMAETDRSSSTQDDVSITMLSHQLAAGDQQVVISTNVIDIGDNRQMEVFLDADGYDQSALWERLAPVFADFPGVSDMDFVSARVERGASGEYRVTGSYAAGGDSTSVADRVESIEAGLPAGSFSLDPDTSRNGAGLVYLDHPFFIGDETSVLVVDGSASVRLVTGRS